MTTPVKLSDLIDGIESSGPEVAAYLDRQTGQVLTVMRDDLSAAEEADEDEEGSDDDVPDWQREAVAQARAIVGDDGTRYLPLPDQFDAHEWRMMEKFAYTVPDAASAQLVNAIHGRGAFRMFKDVVHRLGLAPQWHDFRDGCYRRLVIDWCREHGVAHDGPAEAEA